MNSGFRSSWLLLYGCDPILLETRRLVLKSAGFQICKAARLHELGDALQSIAEPCGLWVICHTVSMDERKAIANLAIQNKTPVFQIESLISPRSLVVEVMRLVSRLPTAEVNTKQPFWIYE